MSPLTPQQALELGKAHHVAGRPVEAEAIYRQLLKVQPGHPEVLHLLGILAHQAGNLPAARELMRQAIAASPGSAHFHSNLGIVLFDLGLLDDAVAAYETALRIQPDFPDALYNLGNARRRQCAWALCFASYRAAIGLKPDHALAHLNLGASLVESGDLEAGISEYRAALARLPGDAAIANNLAGALKDQGDLEGALSWFRQSLAWNPASPTAHSNLAYLLQFHPASSPQEVLAECRAWNRRHAEPLAARIRPHRNFRDPSRRLRIGYVSPNFWAHVIGRNLRPLLAAHDHGEFEIVCYSDCTHSDAVTADLRAGADLWRETAGLSDEALAELIRTDGVDILVDLALHLAGNRLPVFARRPAPVQVTFAGYPGTTGLATIDYRLTDPHLDPPGSNDGYYSEESIRLPHSFWCYAPGEIAQVSALPADDHGWVTFGCLNSSFKINGPVLDLWARVLLAVPGSRLLVLAPATATRTWVSAALARHGIAAERLLFAPKAPHREYLDLYHRLDLMLDTFPYNGHTTSLDALWMGVPVVTLAGASAVARAGVSQLTNLGLSELIAASPEEYVRIATELAGDRERLRTLRASLRDRMEASPLMDAAGFARGIEGAYREIWRRWCANRVTA